MTQIDPFLAPLQLFAGSVTNPGLVFSTSLATGIYSSGTDKIDFVNNGIRSGGFNATGNWDFANSFTCAGTGAITQSLTIGTTLSVTGLSTFGSTIIPFTQLGTGAISSTLDAKLKQNTYTPKDFGCVGDGITDDTVNLQKAITASANAALDLCGFSYKITSAINVSSPIVVYGRGATVTQATTATAAFNITSSNVAFKHTNVVGAQYAANQQSEIGFNITGSSWASNISNILIEDCSASNFGGIGIYAKYVKNLFIFDNSISNINYAGIECLSVQYFNIHGNYVNNLIGSIGNSYGIQLTRATVDSLTTDPQSADGSVVGNIIENNPTWEGLDTHGGLRIIFSGNQVSNCFTGIGVVDAPGATSTVDYAPKDITVTGNTFYSGVSNGTAHYGIAFTGAINGSTTTDWATGTISGNTFEGFGDNTNQLGACIYMRSTSGVVVADNFISEPSPTGILLYYDNIGFSISGNTITDPWTNSTAGWKNGWGIYVNSTNNTGYIGGNTYQRRLKSATTVFTRGIDIFNDPSVSITLGIDSNQASSLNVYDPGGRASSAFWRPINNLAIASPATPSSGIGTIYVDSTSKNLALKNDAGIVNHGIQTKLAVASKWISSIADDGSSVLSQPTSLDIIFAQLGTGAITSTVDAKLKQFALSIMDFGGNGGGTVDNSAALNAAVAAALAQNRTIIWFPAGTYNFTAKPSNFTQGILLLGESPATTVLQRAYTPGSTTEGFLTWIGGGSAAGGCDSIGILATNATTTGAAFALTATSSVRPGNITFKNVNITASASCSWNYDIYADGSSYITAGSNGIRDIYIIGSSFFAATTDSIYIKNGVHWFIQGCTVDSAGGSVGSIHVTGGGTTNSNSSTIVISGDISGTSNLTLDNCSGVTFNGYVGGSVSVDVTCGNSTLTGIFLGSITNNSTTTSIYGRYSSSKYFAASNFGAGNVFTGRYNLTNEQSGLFSNTGGATYFGENLNYNSADQYSVGTFPANRFGNPGGSTTIAFQLDVAPAGTANTNITWTNAFQVNTSGVMTITNSTSTTSSSTGALVVTGGIGVGGGLYSANKLTVSYTDTTTSAVAVQGVNLSLTAAPTAASAATWYGSFNSVTSSGAQNLSSGLYGGYFAAFHGSSGTSGNVQGGYFRASSNSGAGNITSLTGGEFSLTNSAANTITQAFGILIDSITNTGGGTINNAYGIFIQDQTSGATNYAIRAGLGRSLFNDTTASTTTNTGAIVIAGGLGVGGDIFSSSINTTKNLSIASTANTLQGTHSATSGNVYTTASNSTANPASASSSSFYALYALSQSSPSCAQNITGGLVGARYDVNHRGTGVMSSMVGFIAAMQSGTSSGNVTSSTAIQINSVAPAAGSTFATNYGLYIGDQSPSGVTTGIALNIINQTNGKAIQTGTGQVAFNDTTATSSPTTGAVVISGGVGIAGALQVGNTVSVSLTNTSTSGTVLGYNSSVNGNPATASTAQFLGGNFQSNSSASAAGNLTNGSGGLIGGAFAINHFGTGTISLAIGGNFTANLRSGAGAASNMIAGQFQVQNLSSVAINTVYGLNILGANNTGGGSITNNYGIIIQSQTAGGTNYALYANAGLSRFADTTASTSTTTGAVAITGGLGVGGAVYAGGLISSTGEIKAVTSKTAAYTVTANDDIIYGDASGGAFTITLPASPATGEVHTFLKKDSSANTITVSGNGKNINQASTSTLLNTQNAKFSVQYDGTQWWIVG